MHLSIKSYDLFYLFFTLLLVLLSNIGGMFLSLLAIWFIVYNFLKIFKTKNGVFLVIQLFMLMYSIVPLFFFLMGIYISSYQTIDADNYSNMLAVLQIQSIFNVVFFSFAPLEIDFSFSNIIKPRKNSLAWFASIFLMIISLATVDWRSLSSYFNGVYSIETESSIIFDYFMIFVVANQFFCDKKWKRIINIILTIVVSVVCLMLGKRLTAITNILLIYILNFDGKIKKKVILTCFFIGTCLMNAIQFIRVGQIPSLLNVLTGVNVTNGVFRSNPGDIWYASEVIYKLIDTNVFDWSFRIKSFLGTFLNSFLTTGLTPKEALVNIYITENNLFPYPANGGLIGVSTYLWLGYFGVIGFALIICRIIKVGFNNKNMFSTLYAMLVLATFPRWYTYNPRILFKFAFVAIVVYLFVKIVALMGIRRNFSGDTNNE